MTNELFIDDFVRRIAAKSQHIFADAKSGGRARPNHVSIRQNRFWLVNEDGPTPAPDPLHLRFVVIAVKKPRSRFYYGAAYDADASPPPDCYSQDSIVPETDVQAKQADSCATCPKSEWGSATGIGGQLRSACRVYKQLAIKIPGTTGIWQFSIPAASIVKQWDIYADKIETAAKEEQLKHGFPALTLSTCLTECSFDSKTQGVLNFTPLGYIGNRNLMTVEDCEELIKLMDDEALIAKCLWGPEGQKRKQQYLDTIGKTKVEATPIAASALPPQNIESGTSEQLEPAIRKASRRQLASSVTPQATPPTNSPDIASMLSDMGLNL